MFYDLENFLLKNLDEDIPIDPSEELSNFLKHDIFKHFPSAHIQDLIKSLIKPIFFLLFLKNYPKNALNHANLLKSTKSSLFSAYRNIFLILLNTKSKNFLINLVIFSSIVIVFLIFFKHFKDKNAQYNEKFLFSSIIAVYFELYDMKISQGFIENNLHCLYYPFFFKKITKKDYIFEPISPKNNKDKDYVFDFQIKNQNGISENPILLNFQREIHNIIKIKKPFLKPIHSSTKIFMKTEENNENMRFSPRFTYEKTKDLSPGFRIFSRSLSDKRRKRKEIEEESIKLLKNSAIEAKNLEFSRNHTKIIKNNDNLFSPRKKTPFEMLKELEEMKEIVSKVNTEIRKDGYFSIKSPMFKEEEEEQEKNDIINEKNEEFIDNNECSEVISENKKNHKFEEKFEILQKPKKFDYFITDYNFIEKNDENKGYFDELTENIMKRDKNELLRYEDKRINGFTRKFKRIFYEESHSPDERILEVEKKILQKRDNLKIFLKNVIH